MNLFNIKTEKTISDTGKKYQWYLCIGIISNKKWKFGFVKDWYDGPIYYIHLGFFTIGMCEDRKEIL